MPDMNEQLWNNTVMLLLGAMEALTYPSIGCVVDGEKYPAYQEGYINELLRIRATLLKEARG